MSRTINRVESLNSLREGQRDIKYRSDEDEGAHEYHAELQSIVDAIEADHTDKVILKAAEWVGEVRHLVFDDGVHVSTEERNKLDLERKSLMIRKIGHKADALNHNIVMFALKIYSGDMPYDANAVEPVMEVVDSTLMNLIKIVKELESDLKSGAY